jgi:hypothetical protein
VSTQRIVLLTPAINGLLITLNEWIEGHLPGALVYGVPRVGKTKAIKYLLKEIMQHPEAPPYVSLTMRKIEPSTPRAFWSNILSQLPYPTDNGKGTTADYWQRVLLKLTEISLIDDKKSLVLFINDAQKLDEYQYELLHDLHNALDDQDIYTLFVLVGQTQLLEKRDIFKTDNRSEIVGRFMSVDYCMHGIASVDELSFVLEGYDELSAYPKGSKCSYARYFFPEIYQAGWRLAHEAQILWQAFDMIHKEFRIVGTLEVPLQYIFHTINNGLCSNSCKDFSFAGFSLALWKQSILKTGFASAGNYLNPPAK